MIERGIVTGSLTVVAPTSPDQFGEMHTPIVMVGIVGALRHENVARDLAITGRAYDATIMFDEAEAMWREVAGVMKNVRYEMNIPAPNLC
jgi:hypothetical protein